MSKKTTLDIDASTFKQSLRLLGWSYQQAAEELGVHSRQRVCDWAQGRRRVPSYIAANVARAVDIALLRKGL